MKKITFITKLVNEEKINLIEPNENLVESYNKKSASTIKAAKILLEQELYEEATSMFYYSMYNKTTALFNKIGLKCENHSATIILLKELFNINNKDISFIKTERINKQYYTDFVITKKQVEEISIKAEKFIAEIDLFTDSLNQTKINELREKIKIYF